MAVIVKNNGTEIWRLNDMSPRIKIQVSTELVATALKSAGVGGSEKLDPESTPPGVLDEFCASTGCFWVA